MWECLGRQDRSWFGARDVLGYFALRWPPGASLQGGASTPNPRGKDVQKSVHCLPPGWHQLLLTDTEGTDFQKAGVPKHRLPRQLALAQKSLPLPTSHLPTTSCCAAGEEHQRVSRKRDQEAAALAPQQRQSDPESEAPLVSLIWPQTHSFFHNLAPHWGKVKKGGIGV